ncbi:MAG: HipA domain-containing protein [Paludibacteraceae bacterium]|nr:HipA domain-containing protein [Paludibacteraceae bacterium]
MFQQYDNRTLREMFDGRHVSPVLPYECIDADRNTVEASIEASGRMSISGVQPKYAMVLEGDVLRFARHGEQGKYILKTAPTERHILDRDAIPANEHLTMHIASEVYGIPTAKNCLCFFGNGEAAYLTRRFDVKPDGNKFLQEDFASIAGISKITHGEDYKYNVLSYADCGGLIRQYASAAPVEMLKFFRLVLFNYITSNDDAHLKNFSLLSADGRDYFLSPAYDLVNTYLHLAKSQIFALQKGLYEGMIIDDTHSVGRESFVKFGKSLALPDKLIEREINLFGTHNNKVLPMIEDSLLPPSLKTVYYRTYNYRCQTLNP